MLGKSTARLVTLILVALIACGPEPPGMSLLAAVDQGNVDAIRLHMESGTDPDESFVPPGVPWVGASALHIAVIKEYQEVAQVLLDNGADIDTPAQDQFRGSPLEWAAFFGLKEMAVFLVEAGADLNSKNAFGTTPLDATVVDNPFIPQEQKSIRKKGSIRRKSLLEAGTSCGNISLPMAPNRTDRSYLCWRPWTNGTSDAVRPSSTIPEQREAFEKSRETCAQTPMSPSFYGPE